MKVHEPWWWWVVVGGGECVCVCLRGRCRWFEGIFYMYNDGDGGETCDRFIRCLCIKQI